MHLELDCVHAVMVWLSSKAANVGFDKLWTSAYVRISDRSRSRLSAVGLDPMFTVHRTSNDAIHLDLDRVFAVMISLSWNVAKVSYDGLWASAYVRTSDRWRSRWATVDLDPRYTAHRTYNDLLHLDLYLIFAVTISLNSKVAKMSYDRLWASAHVHTSDRSRSKDLL